MKKILGSSLVFLISVIFLFGTTGITFYIHECKSSQTREVFIYPEILKHQSACCCAEEVHGIATGDPAVQFDDPGCCRNTHLYLKASFLGFPVLKAQNEQLIPKINLSDLLTFPARLIVPEKISFTPIKDHSPPLLSGRLLIQAIHQIKIPVPFS